ncbi:DUF5134 domain-containing protein [Streptomyces lichenis]|uniref:DUF5134 domain-containing protein n=1 Tax=Streptomyces lichenis TaxID=2306967 RepID=A0ABT0IJH7_9ACTN|nr:DUF5134 domain-containing protein [Streptomyces lichenis]MCK8681491.1 DUF5134 domain-containing protein [Streptomyces lichenis]
MHGPVVPGWLLVALCAVAGVSCLVRAHGCPGHVGRSAAAGEAVMGLGMAAMAVPAAVAAPPAWVWSGYAALFTAAAVPAVGAVGPLWRGRTGGRGQVVGRGGAGGRGWAADHGHHLVGSLAMVYMALVMAAGGGTGPGPHPGHGGPGGGLPLLTAALLAYYTVYVLRAGGRLVPAGTASPGVTEGWAAGPQPALACRLAMALGMVAMLLAL